MGFFLVREQSWKKKIRSLFFFGFSSPRFGFRCGEYIFFALGLVGRKQYQRFFARMQDDFCFPSF